MLTKGLTPNKFMAWIGSIFLKILGWRIEGKIPDIKKFVIIAAPHTTNWDFPITLAITFVLKIKIYWMGKAAISAGLLAQPPGGSEEFPSTVASPKMWSNSPSSSSMRWII